MLIREANTADIQQMQFIRNAVTENTLSNPDLVTDKDCEEFITTRGKGWVCEMDHQIVGFAIADLHDNNIWALFVHPNYERKGIGRKLHDLMLDWYFYQGKESVWFSTDPQSRAAGFYRTAGWNETGLHGKKEIKFEMLSSEWKLRRVAS